MKRQFFVRPTQERRRAIGPAHPWKRVKREVKKPWCFMALGFIDTAIILLGTFYMGWPEPPLYVMFTALVLVDIVSFWLIARWSANGRWGRTHKIALVFGILLFFIIAAGLQDVEGFRGHSIVSVHQPMCIDRILQKDQAGRAGHPSGGGAAVLTLIKNIEEPKERGIKPLSLYIDRMPGDGIS